MCMYVFICVYIDLHYILFNHSSVNRHLCCFYVLTIIRKAAMNMEECRERVDLKSSYHRHIHTQGNTMK